MAQDSPIHHLSEKCRLGDEFLYQMGDVLLTLRCESLLITRASPKSDDYDLSFLGVSRPSPADQAGGQQGATQR
jgi:hypothetical protein